MKIVDERGMILDVFYGNTVNAVTYITFKKGAVRGNHRHQATIQYDYVLSGKLTMATSLGEREIKAGESITFPPGMPHAYKALEDSVLISMTYGPRMGPNYETDTYRLTDKLL